MTIDWMMFRHPIVWWKWRKQKAQLSRWSWQ